MRIGPNMFGLIAGRFVTKVSALAAHTEGKGKNYNISENTLHMLLHYLVVAHILKILSKPNIKPFLSRSASRPCSESLTPRFILNAFFNVRFAADMSPNSRNI